MQDDHIIEMRKEIYQNISKFRLYRVASKPLILPCLDVSNGWPEKLIIKAKIYLILKESMGRVTNSPSSIRCLNSKRLRLRWLNIGFKSKLRQLTIYLIWKDGGLGGILYLNPHPRDGQLPNSTKAYRSWSSSYQESSKERMLQLS